MPLPALHIAEAECCRENKVAVTHADLTEIARRLFHDVGVTGRVPGSVNQNNPPIGGPGKRLRQSAAKVKGLKRHPQERTDVSELIGGADPEVVDREHLYSLGLRDPESKCEFRNR